MEPAFGTVLPVQHRLVPVARSDEERDVAVTPVQFGGLDDGSDERGAWVDDLEAVRVVDALVRIGATVLRGR